MKKITLFFSLALLFVCAALQARTVYVTRHGQVGDKRYYKSASGIRDIMLTDLGREQAKLLGEYLIKEKKFNGTIMVSPFHRTTETGLIVAEMLGKKVLLEPGIQEIAPGKKGKVMTGAEISAAFSGKAIPGSAFTDDWRCFNEDHAARQERVSKAIDRILKETKGDILLVSHGGTCGNIFKALNDKRPSKKVKSGGGKPWNCSLSIFEFDDEGKMIGGGYTTEYMPDEKVTSNYRAPKVPKPDDPRYEVPKK